MMAKFVLRFVFGLLVLCAFFNLPSDARFKLFPNRASYTLRQRQPPIQMMNMERQRPMHSSGSQTNSMESVNLRSHSSSSADIYRTASSPTFNRAGTSALMRETSSLHREAASSLNNMRSITIQRQNTLLQRLKPDSETLNSFAKYMKNGAIAVAGTGGFISIVNSFPSKSDEKEESNVESNVTLITTTTTKAPEYYNLLGQDK